jgi:hypothetical protein
VVLILKSSSKGFHFITKIFVLFDSMLSCILVLIIVEVGLIIGLVILCLTTGDLNRIFQLVS